MTSRMGICTVSTVLTPGLRKHNSTKHRVQRLTAAPQLATSLPQPIHYPRLYPKYTHQGAKRLSTTIAGQ